MSILTILIVIAIAGGLFWIVVQRRLRSKLVTDQIAAPPEKSPTHDPVSEGTSDSQLSSHPSNEARRTIGTSPAETNEEKNAPTPRPAESSDHRANYADGNHVSSAEADPAAETSIVIEKENAGQPVDLPPVRNPQITIDIVETPSEVELSNGEADPPPVSSVPATSTQESEQPAIVDAEPPLSAPIYSPPTPPPKKPRNPNQRQRDSRAQSATDAELKLRLQLVFGRGGVVKMLALVPDRREGMPAEFELSCGSTNLTLIQLRDDCYEPIPFSSSLGSLENGIEWRTRSERLNCRWILSGRDVYVLAPGDEFGLHGFISTARLWLRTQHVVLATERFRDDVTAALVSAGCSDFEIISDQGSGVPLGWVIYRHVTPTLPVPMREDKDILNVLCPAHDIEPHFLGGIRIERNTYLAGYPPRIRLTGDLQPGFQIAIDGQAVRVSDDGFLEAPGWDSEGAHQLWFGDRVVSYSLLTMEENWEPWPAYDFGTSAILCGARTGLKDGTSGHLIRIPRMNPLLLGARPGEIRCFPIPYDMRADSFLGLVPFPPVWALPIDPLRANKRSSQIVLLNALAPILMNSQYRNSATKNHSFRAWLAAINNASRRQLRLASESDKDLWNSYRALAKQLWRRTR